MLRSLKSNRFYRLRSLDILLPLFLSRCPSPAAPISPPDATAQPNTGLRASCFQYFGLLILIHLTAASHPWLARERPPIARSVHLAPTFTIVHQNSPT